jgi:hypothetical protein
MTDVTGIVAWALRLLGDIAVSYPYHEESPICNILQIATRCRP